MDDRPRCASRLKNGQPCSLWAQPDEPVCWAHSAKRLESHRQGGQARSTAARSQKHLPPVLRTVQETLLRLIEAVEQKRAEPRQLEAVAAAAGRLLDFARWAQETGDLKTLDAKIVALREELTGARREAGG